MILKKLIFLFLISLFFSCIDEESICTKKVNIPLWDEEKEEFIDNFQNLPCDYDGSQKKVLKLDLKKYFSRNYYLKE